MKPNSRTDLPALVKEIKEETERLIRVFDEAFLRSCGVAPDGIDFATAPLPCQRTSMRQDRLGG